MEKTICELFAGVGGFRLGLERLNTGWQTTWFSQWEPGAKTQWAHDCYVQHFGDSPDMNGEFHTGEDISAMEQVLGAGCKIITSIHGYSADSIKKSKGKLLSLFDTAIELKKENGVPKISQITDMEEYTYD